MSVLRFAWYVARTLLPAPRVRHDCGSYIDDVMCYPPACALCGRLRKVA